MGQMIDGYRRAKGEALGNAAGSTPMLFRDWLINIGYIASLIWGLGTAFSLQPVPQTEHVFTEFVRRFGIEGTFPFMFTLLAFCLSGIIYGFILVMRESGSDLGDTGNAFMYLSFSCVSYSLMYDCAYQIGNHCTPLGYGCENFSNTAWWFGMSAAVVYILREASMPLPGEKAVIMWNGRPIRVVQNGGILFIPGAPIPHNLYVFLKTLGRGAVHFMWHCHIEEDGRHNPKMVVHRHRFEE
ncbi:MAG: hypothetical protein WC444_00320 [Candidatus Paceibacterota bacterium]